MAYFFETAHSAVSKKTHMLQVRCANPTGNFAPKRPFGTFRCCGRLICRKGHTMAFSTKRTTFRFAARTLRVTSHRNAPLGHSGVAHGLFSDSAPTCRWHAGVPSGLFGFAETLGLQPLCGLHIPHRPAVGMPVFRPACSALPKRSTFSRFAASMRARRTLFSKTLDLQPLCGLRKGAEGNPSVCCGDNSP